MAFNVLWLPQTCAFMCTYTHTHTWGGANVYTHTQTHNVYSFDNP